MEILREPEWTKNRNGKRRKRKRAEREIDHWTFAPPRHITRGGLGVVGALRKRKPRRIV